MSSIVLFAVYLCLSLSLYYSTAVTTKPNQHIILNVTLPVEHRGDPRVCAIVKKARRNAAVLAGFGALAGLPVFLFSGAISVFLLHLTLWMFLFFPLGWRLQLKASRQLYRLKRACNWSCGPKRLVCVDTESSRLKGRLALPVWWMFPAVCISLVPFCLALGQWEKLGISVLLVLLVPLLLQIILFGMRHAFLHQRAAVFSADSRVNQACSRIVQRGWSVCCTCLSYGVGVFWILLYFSTALRSLALMAVSGVLFISGFVLGILYTVRYVREAQNRLLLACKEPLYLDEDDYWVRGYYYNPDNPKVHVPRCDGTGFTVNLATRGGKAFLGLAAMAFVFPLALAVFLSPLDFGSISVRQEAGCVTVDAPLYGMSFSKSEIQSVQALSEIPFLARTNGAETNRFYVGWYWVDEIGACRAFIHKGSPLVLYIRLTNGAVLINGETPQQTKALHTLLTAA